MGKGYKSMEDEPNGQVDNNKSFSFTKDQGKAGDLI